MCVSSSVDAVMSKVAFVLSQSEGSPCLCHLSLRSLISPLTICNLHPELQFPLWLVGHCTFLWEIMVFRINSKFLSKEYRAIYDVAPT